MALVFEHRFDLVVQLRCVLVAMRGDGMLHRRIEHFLFSAGNFQRAIFLARMISAIDGFSIRHIRVNSSLALLQVSQIF